METTVLLLLCALTAFSAQNAEAQTEHPFSISPRVGDTVDVQESTYFGLFAGHSNFQQAVLFQYNDSDKVFARIKSLSKDTIVSFTQIFAKKIGDYIDSFEYHIAYSDPGTDSASWLNQREIRGIISPTLHHSLYAKTVSIVLRDGKGITGSIAHITESEIILYPALKMVSLSDRPLQVINKRSIEQFNSPFELIVKGNDDAYQLAYRRIVLSDNNWWQNSDLQQAVIAPEITKSLANTSEYSDSLPPETTETLHSNYWNVRFFATALITYGTISTGLMFDKRHPESNFFTYYDGICYRLLAEYEPITSLRLGIYYEKADYEKPPYKASYNFDFSGAVGMSARYEYILGTPLTPPMFSLLGGAGVSFSSYQFSYKFSNAYDNISFAESIEGTLIRWNVNVSVKYNFIKNMAVSLWWMYDMSSVNSIPKGYYFNRFGRIYTQSFAQDVWRSGSGIFWFSFEAGL
jgi:hypothetical protein